MYAAAFKNDHVRAAVEWKSWLLLAPLYSDSDMLRRLINCRVIIIIIIIITLYCNRFICISKSLYTMDSVLYGNWPLCHSL